MSVFISIDIIACVSISNKNKTVHQLLGLFLKLQDAVSASSL